jgi:hypothetical protein
LQFLAELCFLLDHPLPHVEIKSLLDGIAHDLRQHVGRDGFRLTCLPGEGDRPSPEFRRISDAEVDICASFFAASMMTARMSTPVTSASRVLRSLAFQPVPVATSRHFSPG